MTPSVSSPAQPPAGRIGIRQRVRLWWLGKLTRTATHTITRRNLYLLPTGAGCMLAATLLVLLIASINFQLNLGFLLTFMLAGSALVSVAVGYRNLLGLQLTAPPPEPQFAGNTIAMQLQLVNDSTRSRYAIGVRQYAGPQLSHFDVERQSLTHAHLATPALQRGWQPLPAVVADTRFPLGIFRMWTVFRSAESALVYPAPEPDAPPLPVAESPHAGGNSLGQRSASGDFDDVRAYRRGDPLKLVIWKKAATAMAVGSDQFVVRDNQQLVQQEMWLDAGRCGLHDKEAQLSRLTAWVLQADQQNMRYGLRLAHAKATHGTQDIAPDSGPDHRNSCLRALALA